ncbi:MAG TPA: DUF4296 domain-containing protein [Chitinophagaceae bacterium]
MSMRRLWFMTLFIFAACTPEDKKIPKDILPINKMKHIVWDLAQAGAYASYKKEKDTSIKTVNTAYLAEVLKMYNISKADFFKSFNFYQAHPLLNRQLFDSVNAYANQQRVEMYKKRQ